MTQHTEGPWIVSGTLKAGDDFEYVNADGPVVIARIHSPGLHPNTPDPTATCAANARLIAAAPELLEVARECVEHSARVHPDLRARLLAAIAKAETI